MIESNQGQLTLFVYLTSLYKKVIYLSQNIKTKQEMYIAILIECTSAKVCTYVRICIHACMCICIYVCVYENKTQIHSYICDTLNIMYGCTYLY